MNKADICYEYIKEKIIDGEYPPLSTLSEAQLQEELNASRTPVREAILRLKELGFVYVYSQKATIVSELSLDLINELYTVRTMNEPFIYKTVASIVDKEYFESLRASFLAPQDNLSDIEKRKYFADLDNKLHEKLLDYFHNRFILNVMNRVYTHNRRIRLRTPTYSSIQEHVNIIDAVLKNDPKQIEEATLYHIEAAKKISISAHESGYFR